MDPSALLARLERIVEASKVGILTTVDSSGYPRSRWMTPTVVRGRPGFLYAVTSPDSVKAADMRERPKVQWFFQSKVLDEIFNVWGTATLVDNPQAKAEVLEAIGPNLQIFWRVNPDAKNLVVVETSVQELSCFYPMKGEREGASFGGGRGGLQ